MNTNWRNTPGSKQHWLYRGSPYSDRILGMVYEVNPTAFTVYKEHVPNSREAANREFLAEMPTLGDAKDLLMTVVGSQTVRGEFDNRESAEDFLQFITTVENT